MKKILITFCFYFVFSIYAAESPDLMQDTEMQMPDAIRVAQKSVVRIVIGGGGSGTGFFINPTTVVTNQHVVNTEINKGVEDQYIYIENKSMRMKVKRVKQSSVEHDLALLEVEQSSVSHLEMENSNHIKGERIYIVGHSDGGRLKILSGQIAEVRDMKITYYIGQKRLSGTSGAPILNEQGRVVGIHTVTQELGETKYIHIAIQGNALQQLLRRKSFDWYTGEALKLNMQAINWLRRRADRGDTRAMDWIRETFMSGILNEIDEKSVNNNTRSMFDLQEEDKKSRSTRSKHQSKEEKKEEKLRQKELEEVIKRERANGAIRRDTYLQVWDWFTGIAGEGNTQALGWLGKKLQNSSAVSTWFTNNVREGNHQVLAWLADEAEMGNIRALELLMEGANRGNIQALDRLQKMAARPGDNTYVSEWLRQVANPDNIEMMNWLREEAETGNTRVQNWFKENNNSNISDLSPLLQTEAEKGNTQALNWLQQMANRGDIQALNWLQMQGKKGNVQVLAWFRSEALRGNPIVLYWLKHKGQLGNVQFINALLNRKKVDIYTSRFWQEVRVQNWFKEEAEAKNPLAREWLLQQAVDGNSFALEWLKEEWKQNNVQTVEAIKRIIITVSSRGHTEVVNLLQTEAEQGHIQANELLMEIARRRNVQAIRWVFGQSEHNFAMYRWLRREAEKEAEIGIKGPVTSVLESIGGRRRTHAQRILSNRTSQESQLNTCPRSFQSVSP